MTFPTATPIAITIPNIQLARRGSGSGDSGARLSGWVFAFFQNAMPLEQSVFIRRLFRSFHAHIPKLGNPIAFKPEHVDHRNVGLVWSV